MNTRWVWDRVDRALRCPRHRTVAAGCVLVLLATVAFLTARPVHGELGAAADDWERKATQLTQFHLESYSPTRKNTRIKGTYVTELTLGAMAGRSEVIVQCVFAFGDWKDDTVCGTGRVKFTATIGDKTIFKRKAVKFSRDRCHTSIWHSVTVDLATYEGIDALVCTAKVIDKAVLQPVDSASISYTASLKDLTWDTQN